ncbi:MAG: TatD family hydrolase [Burkholderiales bacterium]|nr:TatD family hydrolase [Burkholderiales bacterium]
MLIDSHCHLNFPELKSNLPNLLTNMSENNVDYALVVSTRPDNIIDVIDIAKSDERLFATAGIHPDEKLPDFVLSHDYLLEFSKEEKVVAIGETGLDYYWSKDQDMKWQHDRFQIHIDVAKTSGLPLVIHTRDSAHDVHGMLQHSGIEECGAVIHCFTEDITWARKFLDLGAYISLSGIATFKSATQVHEVAKFVPLDRLLVETDSPYLAPVPYRGKTNQPAYVKNTAQFIADLREINLEELAKSTSNNFFKLFTKAKRV